ncbi:MAG: hypothetical protein ABSF96_02520 [Steroidobacteraceae bacterium]|jgi:hypothetical protein
MRSSAFWPALGTKAKAVLNGERGDSQCELADLTRGERVVLDQYGAPRPGRALPGEPLQPGRKAGVVLQSVGFRQ